MVLHELLSAALTAMGIHMAGELRIPSSAGVFPYTTVGKNGKTVSHPGVDPRVVDILRTSATLFPYRVEVTPAGGTVGNHLPGNHPGGHALDVQIYDASGRALPNALNKPGGAAAYPIYEKFAQITRQVQMQKYPELASTWRWGGGFVQGRTGDWMHFDDTPRARGKMAAYDWNTGLNPKYAQAWGVAKGIGGLGNTMLASLARMGYTGPDAVRQFQADNGLNPDGVIGPKTVTAIARSNPMGGDPTYAARVGQPRISYGDSRGVETGYKGTTDAPYDVGGLPLDAGYPGELPPDYVDTGNGVSSIKDYPFVSRQEAQMAPVPDAQLGRFGTPGRSLKMGDTGADVLDAQGKLASLVNPRTGRPFYTGKLDGVYGPGTTAAAARFQATLHPYSGRVDGVVGPKTQTALEAVISRSGIMNGAADPLGGADFGGGNPRGAANSGGGNPWDVGGLDLNGNAFVSSPNQRPTLNATPSKDGTWVVDSGPSMTNAVGARRSPMSGAAHGMNDTYGNPWESMAAADPMGAMYTGGGFFDGDPFSPFWESSSESVAPAPAQSRDPGGYPTSWGEQPTARVSSAARSAYSEPGSFDNFTARMNAREMLDSRSDPYPSINEASLPAPGSSSRSTPAPVQPRATGVPVSSMKGTTNSFASRYGEPDNPEMPGSSYNTAKTEAARTTPGMFSPAAVLSRNSPVSPSTPSSTPSSSSGSSSGVTFSHDSPNDSPDSTYGTSYDDYNDDYGISPSYPNNPPGGGYP